MAVEEQATETAMAEEERYAVKGMHRCLTLVKTDAVRERQTQCLYLLNKEGASVWVVKWWVQRLWAWEVWIRGVVQSLQGGARVDRVHRREQGREQGLCRW